MWGFWAGCLGLLALALGFVLYPWWTSPHSRSDSMRDVLIRAHRLRRDELQQDVEIGWLSPELYGEAESELDRGLLEEAKDVADTSVNPSQSQFRIGAFLALGVAVLSASLMLMSSELTRLAIVGEMQNNSAHTETLHERLLRQVEQNPEEVDAWADLGDFYRRQGRGEEAVNAWIHANALLDYSDPAALVALADAMAMSGGDWFSSEAVAYLQRALVLDPNHQKALWLSGWAAWQKGSMDAAVDYWERLLAVLPPEEEGVRAMVESWLAEARGESGATAVGPSLQVEVTLAPELTQAYSPGATLFVYARRVDGMPMPLAIWRGAAEGFPTQVVLDDSLSMIEEMSLSQADEVMVQARISESGLAERQSGDLYGEIGPISVAPNVSVQLTINQRVP